MLTVDIFNDVGTIVELDDGQRIENDVNNNLATSLFKLLYKLLVSGGDVGSEMTTHGLKCLFITAFLKLLVVRDSMGLGVQSKIVTSDDLTVTARLVQDLVLSDDVVIFSKTYCPYCKIAKEVFDTLNWKYTVIELDQRDDGSEIQNVLGSMTGAKTVPRVFIKGQFIGGGKEVKALFESGNLATMLKS